jgi:hypothetical protein
MKHGGELSGYAEYGLNAAMISLTTTIEKAFPQAPNRAVESSKLLQRDTPS